SFHPVVERTCLDTMQPRERQRQVIRTLGVVIRVDFTQGLIQYECKFLEIGGFYFKLNDPFVAPFLSFFKEDWRCGKIVDLRTGKFACPRNGSLCVLNDYFLSECVNEMLGATRDLDSKRRK